MKTDNTKSELRIAARASIIETAKAAPDNNKALNTIKSCFLLVLIRYKRNGILNAIEAAVMFLFPAKPFNFRTEYSEVPYKSVKSL